MSSLQNRMYNYEAMPPANSWDRIAAALDEASSPNEFPAKLYDMEVEPPAMIWTAITDSLNEETDEKVIQMKRRTLVFFRYAAAAFIIGVVALSIIKWTGTTANTEGTDSSNTIVLNDSGKNNIDASGEDRVATNENAEDEKALEESKKMVARLDRPARNVVRNAASISTLHNNSNYEESIADANADPLYSYEDHLPDLSERYIMLMTPEGNFIRMSKKWSDLVCCVSGEEQGKDCKDQLKKWQEKIANSPLAPSPGNFLDILSLVNSLDEGVEL